MLATVSREFTFEAAHRLPNHDGKCEGLHGHSYKLRVYAYGSVREADGTSSEGMVVDFGRISEVYREHLEPLLDHKFLNDSLPLEVTTAENLAGWALQMFQGHVLEVVSVRIYETPTSYAEVES